MPGWRAAARRPGRAGDGAQSWRGQVSSTAAEGRPPTIGRGADVLPSLWRERAGSARAAGRRVAELRPGRVRLARVWSSRRARAWWQRHRSRLAAATSSSTPRPRPRSLVARSHARGMLGAAHDRRRSAGGCGHAGGGAEWCRRRFGDRGAASAAGGDARSTDRATASRGAGSRAGRGAHGARGVRRGVRLEVTGVAARPVVRCDGRRVAIASARVWGRNGRRGQDGGAEPSARAAAECSPRRCGRRRRRGRRGAA